MSTSSLLSELSDVSVQENVEPRGCMKVCTLDESLESSLDRKGSSRSIDCFQRKVFEDCIDDEKRVHFKDLSLRQYSSVALDNNPGVTCGPAIALGGNFVDLGPVSLEGFEERRGGRRDFDMLILSEEDRTDRLLDSGYTMDEIEDVTDDIIEARYRRMRTVRNLYKANREEMMESILCKLKDITTLRKVNKGDFMAFSKAAKTA